MANNYTLGRGKVYFSRYLTGTTNPEGFRYIGNTPEMNLNIEQQTLDHYNSDEGIREKDDSVPLEVNRTGSLITDNIDPENVALFFFGTKSDVATGAAATVVAPTITAVIAGYTYAIGATAADPAGVFGLDTVTPPVVKVGAVTMTETTDYVIDYDMGLITIVDGGAILTGDNVDVTYDLLSNTRSRVISGSEPVEGAMMYRTKNPKGDDCLFYFPYVKISPNGDYALKGDEWQQIPMQIEVLKPTSQEAIYRDGVPVYA